MGTGRRVLLVEDDDATCDVLAALLRDDRFDVSLARDGAQALRAVEGRRPDVVVLDLGLPRLDGCGFLALWRARDPGAWNVPVVVMSGLPDAHDLARKAQAAAFMTKPLDLDALLAAVHRAARLGVTAERSSAS